MIIIIQSGRTGRTVVCRIRPMSANGRNGLRNDEKRRERAKTV